MGLCVLDQESDARQDFVSWAAVGIRNEAIRLAERKLARSKREVLILDSPVPAGRDSEEGHEGSRRVIDEVAGPDDTEGETLDHMVLDEALDMLTPVQQQVVLGTVIKDLPEQSIARAMGVSQQTANRIKWTALRKIRPYLTKGGNIDGGLL